MTSLTKNKLILQKNGQNCHILKPVVNFSPIIKKLQNAVFKHHILQQQPIFGLIVLFHN